MTGSNVKVNNIGVLCIKSGGHDSENSFCQITFKLIMYIVDGERRNPIDFGSQSQKSRSNLALCV